MRLKFSDQHEENLSLSGVVAGFVRCVIVGACGGYGLYGNGRGGDILTEGTAVYDYAKKTYTITSSYGDGFKEITTGSYTDTEDSAKTVVHKDGVLFMTREVKTHPVF